MSTTLKKRSAVKKKAYFNDASDFFKLNHREDNLILRVLDEELLNYIDTTLERKEAPEVEIKFTDARKGTLSWGQKTYPVSLVDLPCIIESQLTFNNKNYFKTSDICQMMIVGDIPEAILSRTDDQAVYPDGITPPLFNVRKRRFRKHTPRNVIEVIEQEVQRLLEADAKAVSVEYNVQEVEEVDSALNPDEFRRTPQVSAEVSENEEYEEDGDYDGGFVDMDLLEQQVFDAAREDDEEEEEIEEEEEESMMLLQNAEELEAQIKDLRIKISERSRTLQTVPNPIMRQRLEEVVRNLQEELEEKTLALQDIRGQLGRNIEADDGL